MSIYISYHIIRPVVLKGYSNCMVVSVITIQHHKHHMHDSTCVHAHLQLFMNSFRA